MVRCSCVVVALLVLWVFFLGFFVCVCDVLRFCFRLLCDIFPLSLWLFCFVYLFVCLLLFLLFSNFSSTGRIKTGSLFTNEEPSSIRRTLEPFQRQSWETSERRGGAHMGFSERIDNILH